MNDTDAELERRLRVHFRDAQAEGASPTLRADVLAIPRTSGVAGRRGWGRRHGLTLLAATVALGIGANTAMFTLLRGTLLRPLPNRDGERLVYLRQSARGAGQENVLFSVPEVTDYRGASRTLGELAEYSGMQFTMLAGEEPVHVQAGIVSGNYFQVMGLAPLLGRLTNGTDDGPAAPPVARPQITGRPTNTAVAPRARAVSASEPERIPPST